MHTFTVNYQRDEKRGLLNRGIFIHGLPRPILACRLAGHRPVVDGTDPTYPGGHAARWVVCDRCGTRPEPQGVLPARLAIGQPYTGDHDNALVDGHRQRTPGPWPRPTFDLSLQILLWAGYWGLSAQQKVGNAGSENALAGHLRLGRLFGFYWSTGDLARGLQRRLNPTGYESKIIDVSAGHGRIRWKLWTDRDRSSRDTPRWHDGSIRYRPLDIVLGPRSATSEKTGEPVDAPLWLSDGAHLVTLQLRRYTTKRKRGRKRFRAWEADWRVKGGIPTKPGGRGRILGSSVRVSTEAAEPAAGAWVDAALAAIADEIHRDRVRHAFASVEGGMNQ